jgi:large subunit ribosomal protein L33
MAKKANRMSFGMECNECKSRNYISQKNSVNTKDKITLNKFCKTCRKVTLHNEFKLK